MKVKENHIRWKFVQSLKCEKSREISAKFLAEDSSNDEFFIGFSSKKITGHCALIENHEVLLTAEKLNFNK